MRGLRSPFWVPPVANMVLGDVILGAVLQTNWLTPAVELPRFGAADAIDWMLFDELGTVAAVSELVAAPVVELLFDGRRVFTDTTHFSSRSRLATGAAYGGELFGFPGIPAPIPFSSSCRPYT